MSTLKCMVFAFLLDTTLAGFMAAFNGSGPNSQNDAPSGGQGVAGLDSIMRRILSNPGQGSSKDTLLQASQTTQMPVDGQGVGGLLNVSKKGVGLSSSQDHVRNPDETQRIGTALALVHAEANKNFLDKSRPDLRDTIHQDEDRNSERVFGIREGDGKANEPKFPEEEMKFPEAEKQQEEEMKLPEGKKGAKKKEQAESSHDENSDTKTKFRAPALRLSRAQTKRERFPWRTPSKSLEINQESQRIAKSSKINPPRRWKSDSDSE